MTPSEPRSIVNLARQRLAAELAQPAPEPAPAPPPAAEPATTPEPPGLSDLPPAAREAVEPFLRHFTVTGITLIQPDAPDQPGPYGRGEAGHQAWLMRNLEAQAAEYYRRRDSGALLAEPSEPKRRAVAATPFGRVEIRRDGASRWLLFTGEPPARVPQFATPWYDHARRQAEARFGRPKGGWRFD